MNVGSGNRNHYYSGMAITVQGGRVVTCPLCLGGDNNELHLVMYCPVLSHIKNEILVMESLTLSDVLNQMRIKYGNPRPKTILRLFLGEDGADNYIMMKRAQALERLVDEFFRKWQVKVHQGSKHKFRRKNWRYCIPRA